MTIQEAIDSLRTVIPANERSIFITVEVRDYNHYHVDNPERRQVVIAIWDERDRYEAHSLEAATQACVTANAPDRSAEALLAEAETMTAEG